jgi:ribosomal-protein-alanine N-acetyltransferase
MSLTRPGAAKDLAEIAAIQAACPEAAQWAPEDYLSFDLQVSLIEDRIAGFSVSRSAGPNERELLNIAVAPEFRRRGVGAGLICSLQVGPAVCLFLEVRESNHGARAFYKELGFQEVGVRRGYYNSSPESAIVMKFHSC